MNEQMLIGETLFSFYTSMPIHWRSEELQFRYQGEAFRQHITVTIHMVFQLPELIAQEVYQTEGIRFGFDRNQNQVREYRASFLGGRPMYAVSVLTDSSVTVYFIDNSSIWNNPNIRMWNLVHMENLLLRVNALVLHCSYLMYEGKAILFSAPSGTGKTTQAKLWEKLYPSKIVNGDKAIIQKKGGTWYACGYPFHGSADECLNEQYPIGAVVVVRQNSDDFIETLRPVKKLQAVYSESTINAWSLDAVNQSLDLIGDLVANVPVVCQQCTMQDQACHILHGYLKEK